MRPSRAETTSQYQSNVLREEFGRKTDTISSMAKHDAPSPPSEWPTDTKLFDDMLCIGNYPWEEDGEPRLLSSLELEEATEPFPWSCCFCDCPSAKPVSWKGALMKHVMNGRDSTTKFVLHFPTTRENMFYYCCRFEANPFTMPTFCHDAPLSTLFEAIKEGEMPYRQICLVMTSSCPYASLFFALLDWTLACEKIGRGSIVNVVDAFIDGDHVPEDMAWPKEHASTVNHLIGSVSETVWDAQTSKLNIDAEPFPLFEWAEVRNVVERRPERPIAIRSMRTITQYFDADAYVNLLSAVLLERPILVRGATIGDVAEVVRGLYFMAKPMRWICSVSSVLPQGQHEMTDKPGSYIFGVVEDCRVDDNRLVLVNLTCSKMSDKIKTKMPMKPIPGAKEFIKQLKREWKRPDSSPELVDMTWNKVNALIEPMKSSIITNVSDQYSTFMPELFLDQFEIADREFMHKLCCTQMGQGQIEAESLERSREYALLPD